MNYRQDLWNSYLKSLGPAGRFSAERDYGRSVRLWIKNRGARDAATPGILQKYLQKESQREYELKNPRIPVDMAKWKAMPRQEAMGNLEQYRYKMPEWAQKKVWPNS